MSQFNNPTLREVVRFLLRTYGIAIALTIRSFDPRWGLGARGFGVSIHLHGSLSQSLFAPLIPLWGF